jgi:hypothetical protein
MFGRREAYAERWLGNNSFLQGCHRNAAHLAGLDGSSPVNQPAGIAVRKEKGRTTGPAFSHTLHLRTSAATTM